MYHYVENPRPDRAGIHPCPVEEFKNQLEFLSNHFRLVSVEDVFRGALEGCNERLCALTFDDGTRDHYQTVMPLLKKHKAQGTFFIITQTLRGVVPIAQKNHLLLSRAAPQELIDIFHEFFDTHFPKAADKYRIRTDVYLDKRRVGRDIRVANFKDSVRCLPADKQEQFFAWVFKKFNLDEAELCREFFMGREEIRELHRSGFIIGNHTHTHRAFDSQNGKSIREDVISAQRALYDITGTTPSVFSYPHGILGDGLESTIEILKEEGLNYGVTMEVRGVTKDDNPFLLPRYSTNHVVLSRNSLDSFSRERGGDF
jgi:peptidoglycan/xylan/chitin deacetylase (PgdA/CDA1 family)